MSVPIEDINRLIDETTALIALITGQKDRFVDAANTVDQQAFMVDEKYRQVVVLAENTDANATSANDSMLAAKASQDAALISQNASAASADVAQGSAKQTRLDSETVTLATEFVVSAKAEIEIWHGESLNYRNSALDSKRKAEANAERTDADVIEMTALVAELKVIAQTANTDAVNVIDLHDKTERLCQLTLSYRDDAERFATAAGIDAQTASDQAQLAYDAAVYVHGVGETAELHATNAAQSATNANNSALAAKKEVTLAELAKDGALAAESRTQIIHDATVGKELEAEQHALEAKAYAQESLDNANKLAEISADLINTQKIIATLHPLM